MRKIHSQYAEGKTPARCDRTHVGDVGRKNREIGKVAL